MDITNGGVGANGALLPPARKKDTWRRTPQNKAGIEKRRWQQRPRAARRMGRWLYPQGEKAGNAAVVNGICSRLVRPDGLAFFANHCEVALTSWISMLEKTKEPPTTSEGFIAAFREIDRVIGSGDSTAILPRLAYIQLLSLFEALESAVRSDHIHGLLDLRRGRGVTSVAMDIYVSAQQRATSRAKLLERTRFARRLREFVVESPFFLIIYTNVLETVVDRSSGLDVPTLRLVAARVAGEAPPQLTAVCRDMRDWASSAVNSNAGQDVSNVVSKVTESLLAFAKPSGNEP